MTASNIEHRTRIKVIDHPREGAVTMIIGGLMLLGIGIGMAFGNVGAGTMIGLGLGLVIHYLVERGVIGKKSSGDD